MPGMSALPPWVEYCRVARQVRRPAAVFDATADKRFSDNPLVTGPLAIRSYAGFPLRTADGYVLGGLCVIGYEPGSLDDGQRQVLRALARRASVRLTDHRAGNRRDLPQLVALPARAQPRAGNPRQPASEVLAQEPGASL
ncbi:MAG: GAF domain-containing protein [Frankiales bacterium]|nr:GAF domain-containing protein [Frankiales bacterium]